jgi:hypothetical protein
MRVAVPPATRRAEEAQQRAGSAMGRGGRKAAEKRRSKSPRAVPIRPGYGPGQPTETLRKSHPSHPAPPRSTRQARQPQVEKGRPRADLLAFAEDLTAGAHSAPPLEPAAPLSPLVRATRFAGRTPQGCAYPQVAVDGPLAHTFRPATLESSARTRALWPCGENRPASDLPAAPNARSGGPRDL